MVDMVPEQLIKAGEELFQIEDDIHGPSYEKLPFEMLEARNAMTEDGLSMGAALGEATAAWLEGRITATRTLITNLAEFLVVHSQTLTAIDDFNGSEFEQYADLVERPRHHAYSDEGLSPEGW
jgi:hypothetical protein